MEIQIFRLTWMLFIHRIHIYPVIWPTSCSYSFQFSYSQVTPRHIQICYGREPRPTWSIQISLVVSSGDLEYNYNSLDVIVLNQSQFRLQDLRRAKGVCKLDFYECPPSTIPTLGCYCTNGKHTIDLDVNELKYFADLNITMIAEIWHSQREIVFHYKDDTYVPVWGNRTIPVIEALTCFNFQNGVTPNLTATVGDIWTAQGTLSIANEDKSNNLIEIRVKMDISLFCKIDIRECPPTVIPTGDVVCYCGGTQDFVSHYVYYLKIFATARENQSQARLSAQVLATSGDVATTSLIGSLPTITQASSTNLLPIIIASIGSLALMLIIGVIVFCYVKKYRKRNTTPGDGHLPSETLGDVRLSPEPSGNGRLAHETSKREQANFETDHSFVWSSQDGFDITETKETIGSSIDPPISHQYSNSQSTSHY